MDKITRNVEKISELLDDIKCELEYGNSYEMRMKGFIQEFLQETFPGKVAYTTRVELLELFNEYQLKEADGDEWYSFSSIKNKNKFQSVCKRIRNELGLEIDD